MKYIFIKKNSKKKILEMGCDGGTIPKRDELVRTKKAKQKCAKEITNSAKWNHCHLSQQPLEKPVVADLLGL